MKPLTLEIEYCRPTVRVWERLRILYNAILLLSGVALIWRTWHLQKLTGGLLPSGRTLGVDRDGSRIWAWSQHLLLLRALR
jgi:hypothetical protein